LKTENDVDAWVYRRTWKLCNPGTDVTMESYMEWSCQNVWTTTSIRSWHSLKLLSWFTQMV